MEKEVFEKRIYECFHEVVKELKWQIDYNIREGVYEYCDDSATPYADVKSVLYGIMESAPAFVGKPCMKDSIRQFHRIRRKVKFQFFHS